MEFDPYNEQKLTHYLQLLIDAGLRKQAYTIFLAYEQKLKEDLALTSSAALREIFNKFFSHN